MGRSRGGLTSKIHALVDSNGLPVRLAGKLLSRLKSGSMLLADGGYNADWIRELAMKKGAWAKLPAEEQSQRSDLLQPASLPRSQPGRAVLQPDQTMPSGGDALRQAGCELPCFRSARFHQVMASR
jgi:hypothetical protein